MTAYRLKLDIFEGPLDLLLFLIKKNDIDICDIPIAQITEQYLEYIEMMRLLDLEAVGEFLVMAATLMQIKSKMLLPRDPVAEEEREDPRDELVRRLQEYKLFKEAAERLREKEALRQRLFPRRVDEETRRELEEEAQEVSFETTLFDLIDAFSGALKRMREKAVYEVREEEYTVEQKIHEVLHGLLERPRIRLDEFFSKARCKMEIIVLFIAVLELIRLKEIRVVQKRLFAEIEIVRNTEKERPASAVEVAGVAKDAEEGGDVRGRTP